jgi:D-beta-D-heptose 7-phosphate kinase/D-beta-D-heptose 1-phosphate adenosyltransferase
MGVPAVKFITAAATDAVFPVVAEMLNKLKQPSDAVYVAVEDGATTTTKLRAFDQHEKQRIRIDTEDVAPIAADTEDAVLVALRDYIGPQCRLVVVSDYNKGLITDTVMAAIRDLCGRRNVRFMVDPAKRSPAFYAGAHVISPNEDEIEFMYGIVGDIVDFFDLDIPFVCVTAGSGGLSLLHDDDKLGEETHWGPWPVDRVDAIGAGDAVTAGLALMLCGADPAPMEIAVQFANVLGGWSVAQRRTASPGPDTIRALIEESAGWITMPGD